MADIGHELTEDLLTGLEERIKEEYEIAVADAERKYAAWLKKFTRQKEEQRALYEAGQITKTEYQNWCYRHMMMGKEWEKMRDTLAHDLHNASLTASKLSRNTASDALALNMNYGTYMIEHGGQIDTGFSLYNHDTAEVLLRDENIQLMPGPSTKKAAEIAANKDLQWNMRHIDSAVIQGVLQGESPYDIARRLSQVGQMDYNASVRYARTMITSAQNAGRYQAFRRADKLGVQLTIEWQATLDGRTRHDHRMMHGQRRNVDEPFETPDGFKIMWPADCSSGSSDAPQSEIWNCRCTLLSWVKGFEGDTVTSSPKMGSMTFEEWQGAKAAEAADDRDKPSLVDTRSINLMQHGFSAFPKGDILTEWASRIEPKEGFFDIAMHGTTNAVCFGSKTANMSPRTLAALIRKNSDYNVGESIRLLCCNTGKKADSGYCFAEELANILGVRVDSPDDLLYIQRDGTFYVGTAKRTSLISYLPNQRGRRK